MKKGSLILLCLLLIFSCGSDTEKDMNENMTYKVLAKYNGIEVQMASWYEMSLLLCDHCDSDNPTKYRWQKNSNWKKKRSKVLRLNYHADINYDDDEMEYYTVSEEVKNLEIGEIYWIELEFPRIDMNDIFLGASILDLDADFISAKKATENEITEYFYEEPVSEDEYSDW
jgi:hypothetical protein